MEFSKEQRDAIEARGENLLVSAAAGSGKTAVLVERILRLIEEGASLEGMLIVTFTRAAAAEMRARIQKALLERVRMWREMEHDVRIQGKDGMNVRTKTLARFRKEYEAVSRAQIRTLHSFCEWMLRQYFTKADVPPSFRVDDGLQLAAVRQRAMDEAIDAALIGNEMPFARLCEIDALPDLVERTYEFLWNQPEPEDFVRDALEKYEAMCEDFDLSVHAGIFRERVDLLFRDAEACIQRAMELCKMEGGPEHYLPVLQDDLLVIDDARTAGSAEFMRLPAKRTSCDEALKEAAQQLRLQAKDFVKIAMSLGAGQGAVALTRAKEMLPSLKALLSLTVDFESRYREKKLEAGILEFNDLEHRALFALRDEGVKESLRERFDYVFIDEYQDINPLQEAVLEAISRDDNRFMVGDVKQSIYRFRQADPTIFLDTATRFTDGNGGKRIDLNQNFRSAPHILNAVNHLFENLMNGGAAEIVYDERAALVAGRKDSEIGWEGKSPAVEVLIIETGSSGDERIEVESIEEMPEEELSAAEMEAAAVAEKISQMIGTMIPDGKGGNRPAKPGDFAILLRSPAGVAHIYSRALEARGLTVSSDVGVALFSSPEVIAFRDLLAVIDNRRDDTALLGAMRSVGEFSSDDLALIRSSYTDGSFYQAALTYGKKYTEADDRMNEIECPYNRGLAERVAAFLDKLYQWREKARRMPLADFVYYLLECTDRERISMFMQQETELSHLRMLCAGVASMPDGSIGDFIRLIDQKRFSGDDAGPGVSVVSDQSVRLMSVHKSKGLEFPIVIGANLGRRFNLRDASGDFLMSRSLGFGMRYKDETVSFRAETPARHAICLEKEALSRAEELRVLYVLLTRARDQLVLCGAVRKVEVAIDKWAVREANIFSAACPLDWLGPTLIRHPDGAALRDKAVGAFNLSDHAARYEISIIRADGIGITHNELSKESDAVFCRENTEYNKIIVEELGILEYKYPYVNQVLQKTSVSAKLHSQRRSVLPPERPAFLREKRDLTPAQRGSALHIAMRAFDFNKLKGLDETNTKEEIREQLEFMKNEGILSSEQRGILSEASICSFFTCELGREALAAGILYREQPFNLQIDIDENVSLMQGIIDLCYVRTDGKWVIVDYKTDREHLSPTSVRIRHAEQLQHYAGAVEALTGQSVIRTTVFLFANGQTVDI